MRNTLRIISFFLMLGSSSIVLAGSNENVATIVGGIAGGIIGKNVEHSPVGTIGGAVIGSLIGNQVGSSMDREHHYHQHQCGPYSQWSCYSPRYKDTFIGPDGRLCRHSLLTNEYGDCIYATYCCYRMSRHGFCRRWVRVE